MDIQGQERDGGVRLGEGCHMIGSPSGQLLKKPSQQSGQGHTLALMPQEKREVCVCEDECTKSNKAEKEQLRPPLHVQQSWVLDNLKTQAMILLAVLIFLLSGHFYSKSLTQLSLLHISFHSYSWVFTGGIQVNCLCSRAEGERSMS